MFSKIINNLSSRELSTFFHPETADLVTFTEEVLNRKLHLWCSIVTYGYLHCCDLWISTSTLSLCKSFKTSLILCFLKFILLYLHGKNKKNIRHIFETLHKKMKFSIKDFFSKCDQIRSNCGFGHIY